MYTNFAICFIYKLNRALEKNKNTFYDEIRRKIFKQSKPRHLVQRRSCYAAAADAPEAGNQTETRSDVRKRLAAKMSNGRLFI